jgi:hypothetical protein
MRAQSRNGLAQTGTRSMTAGVFLPTFARHSTTPTTRQQEGERTEFADPDVRS